MIVPSSSLHQTIIILTKNGDRIQNMITNRQTAVDRKLVHSLIPHFYFPSQQQLLKVLKVCMKNQSMHNIFIRSFLVSSCVEGQMNNENTVEDT